jgi:hypothetical protein
VAERVDVIVDCAELADKPSVSCLESFRNSNHDGFLLFCKFLDPLDEVLNIEYYLWQIDEIR